MTEGTVKITAEEYEQLLSDSQLLDALRAAGVDNWDGYEQAFEIIKEWEDMSE